jgi:hypothetical protein
MPETTTSDDTSTTEDETATTTTDDGKRSATDADAEVAKWKALARENEKRAKANADAARKLAEIEDRDKSEQQRANERAEAAEKRAAEAERNALRAQVALAKGLPAKLASRLQGDTEAEMVADADELLAELGDLGTKRPANFDGGTRKTADGTDDMNKRIRQAAGRA